MLNSYLTIAVRNLWRAKQYTFINVLGLGVGLAAIVWAYQNYRYCFSFDDFHADRETVFRGLVTKEGNGAPMGVFPMPAVQLAQNEFSSIVEAVRLHRRGIDVKGGNAEPFADEALFTDPAFFSLFNFPLLKGSNDLSDRSAVLLTEETAVKYFGQEDPIGKEMTFYVGADFQKPLVVKGILKNPPVNSTIRFGMLTHFENYITGDGRPLEPGNWRWLLDAAFFKLKNPADAERLAANFNKYIPQQNAGREDWKVTGFRLVSLEDHRKMGGLSANSLMERPEDSGTYGPMALALLILLSACLNFANTTVARSNSRLKEMGVRKVMGGTKRQLTLQMLLECGAITVLALIVSIMLNDWWIPTYNAMFTALDMRADYFHDTNLLAFVGGAMLLTTLLAGAYPAFYISRFNPANIFKGSVKFGGSNLFSRLLLGLQVAISLITVVAGVGFAENAEFQRTYDYGYDRENVLNIFTQNATEMAAIQAAVQQVQGVEATAGSRSLIGFSYRWRTFESEAQKREGNFFDVGEDYPSLMNLKMAAGRAFDPKLQTDFENALLVNETLAGQFGWTGEQAIGKTIRVDTVIYQIVGTLADFHSDALFDPIQAAAMRLIRPEEGRFLAVRAKPGELAAVHDQAKAAWARLFPLRPWRSVYQDDVAAEAKEVTTNIARIFALFAIVTVLLTATGLFALVSLTVLKKMKEIAVRRVVGATPTHIMALVNKGYFWIFVVGAALGCYGGYALTKLLMDMIFKINSGVGLASLGWSAAAVFVIATLTVSAKVWTAVRTNPAEVLKGE